MNNQNLIGKGIKSIQEGRINFLLFGFIFYFISLKNRIIENIKYSLLRLKEGKSKFFKVRVNNSLMYLDSKDKGISKELYIHKKREFFTTDFFKKFINKDDIVIDIGANIGYYALLEARMASQGKVYALEPDPKNNKLLNSNVDLNNYENIKIFPYAVGNKNGKEKIYIGNKSNWSSFTKNPNYKITNEAEVPIIKLDSFIDKYLKKNPKFIRMDVEGYELNILKSMSELLESNSPLKLQIEIHPSWLNLISKKDLSELLDILKRNNFKVKAIFLEVYPYNYESIKTINLLRKIFGLQKMGFAGDTYEKLELLLSFEDIYTPNVFFERN